MLAMSKYSSVFVSKHYGALCLIVNRGLAAHAGELEPDWVLQLEYWDAHSLDIVRGDHYSHIRCLADSGLKSH